MTHSYVIVRDGVVVAQHQTQDAEVADTFAAEGAVSIDGINPLPQCGWTYSGGAFAPPLG